MKKQNNFFLLLKQGIKGIFKFRIQFIIIMILAFLSIFILSTSLSVSIRLTNSYNKIVKSVPKFDYSATMYTGRRSVSDGENTPTFIPLYDIINFDNVGIQNQQSEYDKVDYNFTFNSFYLQKQFDDGNLNFNETFLTRLFEGNSLSETNKDQFKKNFSEIKIDNEAQRIEWTRNQKNILANEILLSLKAYSDSIHGVALGRSEKVEEKYFDNTMAGELSKEPDYIDQIIDARDNYDNATSQEEKDEAWRGVSLEKRDFYSYIQIVSTTVMEWMKSEYEALFVKTGAPFKGEEISNSGELFYELISGYKFGDEAINEEYIVGDNNYYALNTKVGDEFSDNNKNLFLYTSDELKTEEIKPGISIPNHFLHKKGFRGIVNQTMAVIGTKDSKEVINGASFVGNTAEFKTFKYTDNEQSILQRMDSYENFDLNDYFDDHYKGIIDNDTEHKLKDPNLEIPNKPEDIDWNNFGNQTRVSAYQYHLQQTAKVSGFNSNFRKETYLFDSIAQIRYRAVILNNRDNTNFTILKGRNAINRGEILLSQQYAKVNKIKINDHLRIADALYKVVGFATDTYSYFPTADPDFPVPQTKTSAVIYAYRDTVRDLTNGISSGQSDRSSTQSFNFFLTGVESEYKTDVNKFLALQMNLGKSLKANYEYLNSGKSSEKIKSFFSATKFADSNFKLSWTLQPLALKIFNSVAIIASITIAIIAIIALIICIKKTIHFNAKEIGILKAIGTNPWMISVSYIAQALIITFIIIPLGWLSGIAMQIPFSSMFISYFSSPYDGFIFEGISFALSFIAFGALAIFISLFSAFLLTNKSVMEILVVNTKWSTSKLINRIKNGLFKNAKFTLKFSLTLASSGRKPIALLVTVIAFSSILVSTGLAIPSVALNAQKSYYKSVKYSNSYRNKDMTSNSPLSKTAYAFWEGQDALENDFSQDKIDMDGTGVGYGYYKTPNNYNSSTFDTTPISKYVYSTKDSSFEVHSSFEYLVKNPDTIFNLMSDFFGNHFYTVLGQTFSIGMVDQMFAMILNSKHSLDPNIEDKDWNDEKKLAMVRQISSSVTESIPTLIKAIMGSVSSSGGGSSESNNWKQQIIDVLMNEVPPYVKGYIQKESRLEQYALGYNYEQYIPTKESISTELDVSSNEYNSVKITGLDKSQSAYKIENEDQDKVFIDKKTIKELSKVFDSPNPQEDSSIKDIYLDNGFKLYDKSSNTVTAPVITNEQSRAVYKLKKDKELTNLSTKSNVLQITNSSVELPKQAWIYNDNDYAKSDFYKTDRVTAKDSNGQDKKYADYAETRTGILGNNYLDPYAIDNNKFTYAKQYLKGTEEGTNKIKDRTAMFNDFSYDEEGEIQASLIRPYYEYKNIELYVPYSQLENGAAVEGFLYGMDPQNRSDKTGWYEKEVSSDNVPETVQKAWGTQNNKSEKYLLIRPFDTTYTLGEKENQGFTNLLAKPAYWFKYALSGEQAALKHVQKVKTSYVNKDLKVNVRAVGNMTSYNDKIVVMDSSLTNLVANLSTARKVGIKDTTFDYNTKIAAGVPDEYQNVSDKFNRYVLRDANSKDVLNTNWWELTYMGKDALNYAPLYWHNGKYSNVDEPLGLTSGISYVAAGNTGQYSLGLGGNTANEDLASIIDSQKLLSTSKDFINQISILAASIGMLLIVAVIITAALLIMLVGDIYISQYQKFMILMRALGYSNWKVQKYAFGTVIIFGLLVWILATAVTWGITSLGILGIYSLGLAIPFGISWWPPVLSFVIIMSSFIGSLIVSSGKVRRGNPSQLMTGFGD